MSDDEKPEASGEEPPADAGGSTPVTPELTIEPKGDETLSGDDGGEEKPEASAFESMSLSDIENLKDDELAGFQSWLDGLPPERREKFPGMRQVAEADTRRAADERREGDQRQAEERLGVLDHQANQSRDRVIEVVRSAGESFYEKVKAKAGDDFDLADIPFEISQPDIQAALDKYAAARVPKLASTAIRNIGDLIQDTIEEQGEPLTRDDLERMLDEAEKAGKPQTWAYLQEVARRAKAAGRSEANAEWEAKIPGERAAIRTQVEKGMDLEKIPVGAGARRNGKAPKTQAQADKMHISGDITSAARRQIRDDPSIPD